MIMENTPFYKGESKNDPELTVSTANLENVFENSGFNTVRRAHSSMEGITKFLKPYVSGFLLKKEPEYLKAAVDKPKKPMAAIVGGAKVSTKSSPCSRKIDKLIIDGSIVFTFLKVRGISVGNSLVKADSVEETKVFEAEGQKPRALLSFLLQMLLAATSSRLAARRSAPR